MARGFQVNQGAKKSKSWGIDEQTIWQPFHAHIPSFPAPHMHRDRDETCDGTLLATPSRIAPCASDTTVTCRRARPPLAGSPTNKEIREPSGDGK